MHIDEFHQNEKPVSAAKINSDNSSALTSIRILAGESLKAHTTAVPAMLIFISGKANFKDVTGRDFILTPGTYFQIPVNVEHWVDAEEESNFILLKS
jgi:quercetin dioxygenase-like cupin family protein